MNKQQKQIKKQRKSIKQRKAEISKKFDILEGRKELVLAMVKPIRKTLGLWNPEYDKKVTIKKIISVGKRPEKSKYLKPIIQYAEKINCPRPTQEEIDREKERIAKEEADRLEKTRVETIVFMRNLSDEANIRQHEWMGNTLLHKIEDCLREEKNRQQIDEIKQGIENSILKISQIKQYQKAKERLTKTLDAKINEIIKLQKEEYNRTKKQYGKKFADLLFYETQKSDIKLCVYERPFREKFNKKLKEINDAENNSIKARESSNVDCPRVAYEDLSVSNYEKVMREKNLHSKDNDVIEFDVV